MKQAPFFVLALLISVATGCSKGDTGAQPDSAPDALVVREFAHVVAGTEDLNPDPASIAEIQLREENLILSMGEGYHSQEGEP